MKHILLIATMLTGVAFAQPTKHELDSIINKKITDTVQLYVQILATSYDRRDSTLKAKIKADSLKAAQQVTATQNQTAVAQSAMQSAMDNEAAVVSGKTDTGTTASNLFRFLTDSTRRDTAFANRPTSTQANNSYQSKGTYLIPTDTNYLHNLATSKLDASVAASIYATKSNTLTPADTIYLHYKDSVNAAQAAANSAAIANTYTKSQTDALLFDKANNSTVAGLSNAVNARVKYSDSGTVYITPSQLAASNATVSNTFTNYYTKAQSDAKYYLATNPSGYISSYTETDPIWTASSGNYRTFTQNNGLYAVISHTHIISQIVGLTDSLAAGYNRYVSNLNNFGNYYTKTQSDARYLQSFTETDPAYTAGITNYYTKGQSDTRYLQSFTETDPTVPGYSKSLTAFSVIKASTDPLYKAIGYTPTSGEITTALGYTPYNGATNPNSYTTTSALTTGLAGKEPTITAGTTAQYWRGDKTWQTLPVYTAGAGITISSGVISRSKRSETFTATTAADGTVTVTFANTYSVAPNIQVNQIGGTALQGVITGTPTTTSVVISAYTRATVSSLPIVGVLSATLVGTATNPLAGATVHVLVTEN